MSEQVAMVNNSRVNGIRETGQARITVAQVRKALQECIATRWEPAAKGNGCLPEGAPRCQLCAIYPVTCDGCPIMEYTGHSGCRGTPYLEWRETLSPYHAQAEVYFLRSVDYHFFGEGSQARVDAMLARRRG